MAVSDSDLDQMSGEQLISEVVRLRNAIREHRDSSLHELCWHHPALWGLLPEHADPQPQVPAWPDFLQGCIRYRRSLDEQAPNAPRVHEPYRPHEALVTGERRKSTKRPGDAGPAGS